MSGISLDQILLDAATSSIAISDGTDVLEINGDGSLNATVTATDLDIRDLTHVSDSIKVGDGTDFLEVNADGSINVNLTDDGVADGAADSGNPFKVGGRAHDQSAVLGAVDAGDRFDLLGDLYRRVWVNKSANIALKNSAATVTATAAQVLASPLAGRQTLTIQNKGNNAVYIGFDATVTSANGVEIPKGASATYDIGEAIDVFMISSSGSVDVRFLEVA